MAACGQRDDMVKVPLVAIGWPVAQSADSLVSLPDLLSTNGAHDQNRPTERTLACRVVANTIGMCSSEPA
jgi:hypothetical protein